MMPLDLAKAAIEIASRFPDALIYVNGDRNPELGPQVLAVDVDQVWPDCNADAICEGAGEFRLVAWIIPHNCAVEWNPEMPKGHDA